jgi:hypothetical protein
MSKAPQDKSCFIACASCYRCEKKGSSACPSSWNCSGHIEVTGGHPWDPYDRDDYCRCKEGILQIRLKSGRLVQRRFLSSPFADHVQTDAETTDERDWNAYIDQQRELRDDPTFDGLTFSDGSRGVTDWMRNARKGR